MSALPRLREGHSARLMVDSSVGLRRCVLYRISPPAEASSEPASNRQPARLAMGDATDAVIEMADGRLTITVPLSCVRQVYYRRDRDALWFSDDPRLLVRPGMSLDTRGLLAHLELAAPVAPFTMWREIRRIHPGTSIAVKLPALDIHSSTTSFLAAPAANPLPPESPDETRVDRLGELLDEAIRDASPQRGGLVLFSGGVDSGVIAARIAKLGWRDVVLAHSSRGPRDGETAHARRMAAALNLELRVFDYAPDDALADLTGMFDAYATVNDFSMLPTWALARQVSAACPPSSGPVWDGSASDALFGGLETLRKARALYRAPAWARSAAGFIYRQRDLWMRDSRAETILRIAWRSALWPYPLFAIMLHPMAEIAYTVPREVRKEVAGALQAWMETVTACVQPAAQPKVLGVVFNNCGAHCQKPAAALENAGLEISFPFLNPKLGAFALQEVATWPAHLREGKGAMKQLLTRSVPHDMVHRPKSGFSIPPAKTFGHPALLSAFSEVIEDSSGPFAGLVKKPALRRLYQAIERKQHLAWYTYEFVWALVFGHHWVARILEHAAAPSQPEAWPGAR